jgi:hypothetical protein
MRNVKADGTTFPVFTRPAGYPIHTTFTRCSTFLNSGSPVTMLAF